MLIQGTPTIVIQNDERAICTKVGAYRIRVSIEKLKARDEFSEPEWTVQSSQEFAVDSNNEVKMAVSYGPVLDQ